MSSIASASLRFSSDRFLLAVRRARHSRLAGQGDLDDPQTERAFLKRTHGARILEIPLK